MPGQSIRDYVKTVRPSNVSLKEMRAVWDTNVFGVLTVYQAMLLLLPGTGRPHRQAIERLWLAHDELRSDKPPTRDLRPGLPFVQDGSQRFDARHGQRTGAGRDQVNAVSRGSTKTNLSEYAGTETVEEGAREAVRVALLGPDSPTGTFTHAKLGTLPW